MEIIKRSQGTSKIVRTESADRTVKKGTKH